MFIHFVVLGERLAHYLSQVFSPVFRRDSVVRHWGGVRWRPHLSCLRQYNYTKWSEKKHLKVKSRKGDCSLEDGMLGKPSVNSFYYNFISPIQCAKFGACWNTLSCFGRQQYYCDFCPFQRAAPSYREVCLVYPVCFQVNIHKLSWVEWYVHPICKTAKNICH